MTLATVTPGNGQKKNNVICAVIAAAKVNECSTFRRRSGGPMPEYTERWLYLPMGILTAGVEGCAEWLCFDSLEMAAKHGDEGVGFWFALINEIHTLDAEVNQFGRESISSADGTGSPEH